MALYWPDKDPDEIADYKVDWSTRLDGDIITASTWNAPAGITINSASFTADSATVWLSGGAEGGLYKFVNRITTASGRQFEETVFLRGVNSDVIPITLEQAKAQCNVFHTDDDRYIDSLIAVALEHVEKYCNAYFYRRNIAGEFRNWSQLSMLPWIPTQSIASIEYVDSAGAPQTLANSVYLLRCNGVTLKSGQSWPVIHPDSVITVNAVAGFDECPRAARHAALLLISDLYERREPEPAIDMSTFDGLLANHRYY